MKTKNQQKLLTVVAAAAIALLVGDSMVRKPLVRVWRDRANRIATLTASLSNGKLLLDREKNIRERWGLMKSNSLPANASVAESKVLKSVDRWAQDSRISFTSFKPQWKQNGEEYQTLECKADAFGPMPSLARFLYELEKDPLALRLEELDITPRDKEGQQLTLAVRFSGLLLTPDQP